MENESGEKPSTSPEENNVEVTPLAVVDNTASFVLLIEIADAVSEKDRVLFTINTTTTLTDFKSPTSSVVRSHDDFVWLHSQFEENPEYSTLIIPSCPPKPDFDISREKLTKLSEAEGSLTEDEVNKLRIELEAEYLATFKKTVAMHDTFLKRVAAHPSLRNSYYLRVFLEYDQELCLRMKNRRERWNGFFQRSVSDPFSRIVLTASTVNHALQEIDKEDDLKESRKALVHYHQAISDGVMHADKMVYARKTLASDLLLIPSSFLSLYENDRALMHEMYGVMREWFERMRACELRIAADQDLKLTDSLRYYRDDSGAALRLLERRKQALLTFSNANETLKKAQKRSKNVETAEKNQENAFENWKLLTDSARSELSDFQVRRVSYFRRNLIELAELEIRNQRNLLVCMRAALKKLRSQPS